MLPILAILFIAWCVSLMIGDPAVTLLDVIAIVWLVWALVLLPLWERFGKGD